MIESFFSKMTKQMLKGIRVKSKEELADRIYLYFEEVNRNPVLSEQSRTKPAERGNSSAFGHQTLPDIIPQDK